MRKCFSLSFLLHIAIFCTLLLPLYFYHQQAGNTQNIKINFQTGAFLFKKLKTVTALKHFDGLNKLILSKQSNTLSSQSISGRQSKLLFFLHDAIQKNLLTLNTKANINIKIDAVLAFTVLPSGQITQARLINSTKNPQIDRNILKSVTLITIIPAKIRPEKSIDLGIHVKTTG